MFGCPDENRNVRLTNKRGSAVEVVRRGLNGEKQWTHEDRKRFVKDWVDDSREELKTKAEDIQHERWLKWHDGMNGDFCEQEKDVDCLLMNRKKQKNT